MKFSIVTVSFNQSKYIKETIDSVLSQGGVEKQYIVVDPGSTDGSREIIESYKDMLVTVFKKDNGAADGLNNGLSLADGDVFCYLNSDDTLMPDALQRIEKYFIDNPDVDVVYGNGFVIDEEGSFLRKCYSDNFNMKAYAYGSCVVIQPSCFFRLSSVKRISGFNVNNRCNWDGEFFIDLARLGVKMLKVDDFLSCYRVHGESITGSAKLMKLHNEYRLRMFSVILGREWSSSDKMISYLYRLRKHLLNPVALFERVFRGPIFGSVKK